MGELQALWINYGWATGTMDKICRVMVVLLKDYGRTLVALQ